LPRREWAESAVGRAPQRTRMDVVISAGRVITPSGDLTPGSVEISDGRIVAVRAGAAAEADLAVPDGVLAPGLIDLQINGAAGVDFLSPVTGAALTRLRRYLASTGVTAFLPTLITSPPALLQRALRSWQRAMHEPGAPRIVGVHLEGPYLNRQFKGAHPLRYLRAPDARHAAALLDAVSDTVRLVTLAPELPGAAAVIRALRDRRRRGIAARHPAGNPHGPSHRRAATFRWHDRRQRAVDGRCGAPRRVDGVVRARRGADGVIHPRPSTRPGRSWADRSRKVGGP